jgi:hypothetical protein
MKKLSVASIEASVTGKPADLVADSPERPQETV